MTAVSSLMLHPLLGLDCNTCLGEKWTRGMHGSWDGELGMLCVVPPSMASLWGPLWISFYARDQVKISPHFADEENRGLSKEKIVAT